jgi:FixJ family two-component response regulator
MPAYRTVYVIDDDSELRHSVCALLESMGCQCRGLACGEEFLDQCSPSHRGVVVADLRMPGMSGLDLQEEMGRRNIRMPIIILTAHARTATTVRAMQAGAMTTIDKPYHDDELWDSVRAALAKEQSDWVRQQQYAQIHHRWETLTPDERLVLERLVEGKQNKSIARELNLSLRTIEKRRHEVFAKMEVESIAELVGVVHALHSLI